jgi:hypothetical protein
MINPHDERICPVGGYEVAIRQTVCTDGTPFWVAEIRRTGIKVVGRGSFEGEDSLLIDAQAKINRANQLYRQYLQDELTIAVNWWVNQLRSVPSYDPGFTISTPMRAAMLMSDMQRSSLDADVLSAFQAQLLEESHRHLALSLTTSECIWQRLRPADINFILHTDYQPEGLLEAIARSLSIEFSRFPVKSSVSCSPGKVIAQRGYSGQLLSLMTLRGQTKV